MILSLYIAMLGVGLWFLHFADVVNMTAGIIGMFTACICLTIANFKYQRMQNRLRTAESLLLAHSQMLIERIREIERKMDDDGK